ncbi:MAG: hypothetical protein RLZZ253_2979, partial [Verrucomicrobiota bacterium]
MHHESNRPVICGPLIPPIPVQDHSLRQKTADFYTIALPPPQSGTPIAMPRIIHRVRSIHRQNFGGILPVIILLLLGLLMTDSTNSARAEPPQAIPDPRPAHHVVDLTGTLAPNDVAAIDASARRASVHGELMVVVVQSTDGKNPREWTTRLFNQFALDTRRRNRGVLLMAALADRKAEIVVGNGFPA